MAWPGRVPKYMVIANALRQRRRAFEGLAEGLFDVLAEGLFDVLAEGLFDVLAGRLPCRPSTMHRPTEPGPAL